jgi:phosphoglycolate phosphatase-like HAD superfamily hydrolase
VGASARFEREIAFDELRAPTGKGEDQLMSVFVPLEEREDRGQYLERRRGKIFREKYLPHVRPLPGARDLLRRSRAAELRLVLACSTKAEELSAPKDIPALLQGNVDAETCAYDAERSKPYRHIFVSSPWAFHGLGPEEAIAVGDTPYDEGAAGKAGIAAVGVLSGGFSEGALRESGCLTTYCAPDHVLADLDASPLAGPGAA